jgi:outer membrane protein insertion porin family
VKTCGLRITSSINIISKKIKIRLIICESDFIKMLSCSGNTVISTPSILSTLYHKQGSCFLPESLESDTRRIKNLYNGTNVSVSINIDIKGGHEKELLFIIKEPRYVSKVSFIGNTVLKHNELEKLYFIDKNAILSKYHSLGYFDISISDTFSTTKEQIVEITEGKRRVCGQLRIAEGGVYPTDSIRYHASWIPGKPFSTDVLKICNESILKFHSERAYPFTEIRMDDIMDSAGIVSPLLTINANDRFYLGSVAINGGEKIKPTILTRLTKLEPGSPFNETAIAIAHQRLLRSMLFERVDSALLSIRSGYRIIDVAFIVNEGSRNQAEGILGYAPSKDDKGKLTGLLRLHLRNLLGTGRSIGVNYQSEASFTSASVSYKEPWLFGTLFDAEGMVDFKGEENAYTRLDTKLLISYPLSDYLKVRTGVINSTENRYSYDTNFIPITFKTFQTVFGILFDNRDDFQNPRKGILFDVSGETSRSLFKPFVHTEYILRTSAMQVAAFQAGFEAFAGSEAFSTTGNLPFIGGTETVRGYRERQFSGLSTLYFRSEYRFLTGNTSRFTLFTDIGFCDEKSPWLLSIRPEKDLLIGTGFGILLGTRAGQLGLLYGIAVRESLRDGKIHISLRNEF